MVPVKELGILAMYVHSYHLLKYVHSVSRIFPLKDTFFSSFHTLVKF